MVDAPTRGGEARPMHTCTTRHRSTGTDTRDAAGAPAWYAVWTRSQCEQLASDDLAARGFEVLAPKAVAWIGRGRQRRREPVPVFPGYVFVRHALDRHSHVEMLKARGVVRLLGTPGDGPTPIPPGEIDAVARVTNSPVPMFRHPYLTVGRRARIVGGPFAGLEGILLRSDPMKGLLVLSVHLLQRSVAVEVDCTLVEAA